jgi:uncharacterized protein (TIGR02996 family)
MSPEQKALYAAVVASPDDDLPRLVYADWLEEHGDADRAEFIRVQCRLARSSPADADYFELREREIELTAILGEQLEEEHPPLPDGFDWEEEVRGFPYRVTFNSDPRPLPKVESQLERIARLAPVQGLWAAGGLSDRLSQFVRRPAFGRFEHLFVDAAREFDLGGFVAALAASPHVGRLRDLQFPFLRFDDSSFAAFCRTETLRHLTRFDASWEELTPQANTVLRSATWRESLEQLHLFGGRVFPAVAAGVRFPRLHTLFLFDSDLTPALADCLNDETCLPALAEMTVYGDRENRAPARGATKPLTRPLAALFVQNANLGPKGVRRLLSGPTAQGLRMLELDSVDTGDDWPTDLARLSLPALRVFRLSTDTLTGESLAALSRAKFWQNLTEVHLFPYPSALTAKDWETFFGGWHAPHIRGVSVRVTKMQDRGVRALLANPSLASVRSLDLYNCGIGEKAARDLFTAPQLQHLTVLDLSENKLGVAPEVLADPGVLPHAKLIKLGPTKLTPAMRRKLHKRPEVRFQKR